MNNQSLKKSCLTLIFIIASVGVRAQFSQPLANMLQDTLNYYVSQITNVKGMSASVYLPGQGTWQGTAGLSYSGAPITANMQFGIASNTKLFVAAAILKLTESNILNLSDSLKKWIPAYANVNPNITIRQLLNHTSGVQDPIFLPPWVDTIMKNPTRVFTPQEVLSWVGAPLFAPGTNWGYSNVNYILAGMVAESATGIHISKIIRDSILSPLNLSNSFYDVKENANGTLAHRWYNSLDYNDTSRVGLNTAGGCAGAMFSTSGDMAKWYNALFTGQLLKPASLLELTTFVTTPQAYTYSFGLEKQLWFGHTTYGHGGSTWGYKSRMVYEPCMGAVVCGLVNSWPAGMDGITLLLYSVVLNHVPGCPPSITGPASVCKGQKSVIYSILPVANATSYIWTLPGGATGTSTTNSITVDFASNAVSGNITVRGNSIYGVGQLSSLFVNVKALPAANITAAGPTTFCTGGNVLLNAPLATNYLYQWKKGVNILPGDTMPSYNAKTGGSYKVIVTNKVTGCSKTTTTGTVVTVNPLPTATITAQGPTTFCNGDSVVLAANSGIGYMYQWKKGSNILAGKTSINYTAVSTGTYRVIVTNANLCSKLSSGKIVTVNCRTSSNADESAHFTFYPNPTTGNINIELDKTYSNIQVTIKNIIGQEIFVKEYNATNIIDLNLDAWPGIYFIELKTDDEKLTVIKAVKK
ncbi:MAG: serine hydrolase [Bacteroidetes bacterium]|nr:serine hydrolase [Bacteroidota bacterium]